MSGAEIAVLLTAIGGLITGIGGLAVSRGAQQRSHKVDQAATLLDGYDRIVADLESQVDRWKAAATEEIAARTDALREAAERLDSCRNDCEQCQATLNEVKREVQALRFILDVLRRELGLPSNWDPFALPDNLKPYGRREEDDEPPPPGFVDVTEVALSDEVRRILHERRSARETGRNPEQGGGS